MSVYVVGVRPTELVFYKQQNRSFCPLTLHKEKRHLLVKIMIDFDMTLQEVEEVVLLVSCKSKNELGPHSG